MAEPLENQILEQSVLSDSENEALLLNYLMDHDGGSQLLGKNKTSNEIKEKLSKSLGKVSRRINEINGGKLIFERCSKSASSLWNNTLLSLDETVWKKTWISDDFQSPWDNNQTNASSRKSGDDGQFQLIPRTMTQNIASILNISDDKAESIAKLTLLDITQQLANAKDVKIKDIVTANNNSSFMKYACENYFQQCLSDIRILVECLSLTTGEGEDHFLREECCNFLVDLDSCYIYKDGSTRGLLRLLIEAYFSASLKTSQIQNNIEIDGEFSAWLKKSHQNFIHCFRNEAIDGLLILLYQYIEANRMDLAIILTLWEKSIDSDLISFHELSWIGAECFALWKFTLPENQSGHILLEGANVRHEINSILQLLSNLFSKGLQKHQKSSLLAKTMLIPEILPIFCMGLFLLTVYNKKQLPNEENNKHFKSMAVECLNTANEYGIFDYLHHLLTSHTSHVKRSLILYHNISREIFLAALLIFHPSSEDDIVLFSKFGSSVYNNIESICIPFWYEWDTYASNFSQEVSFISSERLVCRLLHLCQTKALGQMKIASTQKNFIKKALCYMELLSSLVYDSITVQYTLQNLLPYSFLKQVLSFIDNSKNCETLLSSFLALLKYGGYKGVTMFNNALKLEGISKIHALVYNYSFKNEQVLRVGLELYRYIIYTDSKSTGYEYAYSISFSVQRDLNTNQLMSSVSVDSYMNLILSLIECIPDFFTHESALKRANFFQMIFDFVRSCCFFFSNDVQPATVKKILTIFIRFIKYLTATLELENDDMILSIRDELILHILPQKSVATKIADLAVAPISESLQENLELFSGLKKSDSNSHDVDSNQWIKILQTKSTYNKATSYAAYVEAILKDFNLLTLPITSKKDITRTALELIQVWDTCTVRILDGEQKYLLPPTRLLLSTAIALPLVHEMSKKEKYPINSVSVEIQSTSQLLSLSYLDLLLRYVMAVDFTFFSEPIAELSLQIISFCLEDCKADESFLNTLLQVLSNKNLFCSITEPILSGQGKTQLLEPFLSFLESTLQYSFDLFQCFMTKDDNGVFLLGFLTDCCRAVFANDSDLFSLISFTRVSSLIVSLTKNCFENKRGWFFDDIEKHKEKHEELRKLLMKLLNVTTGILGEDTQLGSRRLYINYIIANALNMLSYEIWYYIKSDKSNSGSVHEMIEDILNILGNCPVKMLLQLDSFEKIAHGYVAHFNESSNVLEEQYALNYLRSEFGAEEFSKHPFTPSSQVKSISKTVENIAKKLKDQIATVSHEESVGFDFALTSTELISSQNLVAKAFQKFVQVSLLFKDQSKGMLPLLVHEDFSSKKIVESSNPSNKEYSKISSLFASPSAVNRVVNYSDWNISLSREVLMNLIGASSSFYQALNALSSLKCESDFGDVTCLFFYISFASSATAVVQTLLSLVYSNENVHADLFDLLYQCAKRLFSLLDPPSLTVLSSAFNIKENELLSATGRKARENILQFGCIFKENIISLASLLVKKIDFAGVSVEKGSDFKLVANSNNMIREPRLGFIYLICDTLRLLRYEEEDMSFELRYSYDFYAEVNDGRFSNGYTSLKLYRSGLDLLDNLIFFIAESSYFHESMCQAILSEGLVPLLLQHFQTSTKVASFTYKQRVETLEKTEELQKLESQHENACNIAQRIMEVFLHLIGASSSSKSPEHVKLLEIILDNQLLIRAINENYLLLQACEMWSSKLSHNTSENGRNYRGYVVLSTNNLDILQQRFKNKANTSALLYTKSDPVHSLWRTVLTVVTALLRLALTSKKGFEASCLHSVLDFVMRFEKAITTAVYDDVPKDPTSKHDSSSPEVVANKFSANSLRETCEVLCFLNVLFSDSYRSQFINVCPSLYNRLISSTLEITRKLSTFIGTAAIARRLFSSLNRFDTSPMNPSFRQYSPFRDSGSASFSLGIPNARHEAISYAHYASNCCIGMTAEDLSDSSVSSNIPEIHMESQHSPELKKSNLDKFQIFVNNKFMYRMEEYSVKCLFHSLSILTLTHPVMNCLMRFSGEEIEKLSPSSISVGDIIALRSPFNSSLEAVQEKEELRYAKVVSSHLQGNKWDVEYFNDILSKSASNEKERFVTKARVAGILDMSNHKSIFANIPLPKTQNELVSLPHMSIAHILLILQWCKEQLITQNSKSVAQVKVLSERAALMLSIEIPLLQDCNSHTSQSSDVKTSMKNQISEIFDDYQISSNIYTGSPNNKPHEQLKSVMNQRVWETTVSLLHRFLESGNDGKVEETRVASIEQQQSLFPCKGGLFFA